MGDKLTPEKRSWNMSRIKSKNTSIELQVRKYLFSKGFRYRINDSKLPGKPDIVIKKYNTIIFINGCFWHRHKGCKYCTTPHTNVEYWKKKFSNNIKKDKENYNKLYKIGWKIIIIWECELKKHFFENTMDKLIYKIKN